MDTGRTRVCCVQARSHLITFWPTVKYSEYSNSTGVIIMSVQNFRDVLPWTFSNPA